MAYELILHKTSQNKHLKKYSPVPVQYFSARLQLEAQKFLEQAFI